MFTTGQYCKELVQGQPLIMIDFVLSCKFLLSCILQSCLF